MNIWMGIGCWGRRESKGRHSFTRGIDEEVAVSGMEMVFTEGSEELFG